MGISVLLVMVAIAVFLFIKCGAKSKKYEYWVQTRESNSLYQPYEGCKIPYLPSAIWNTMSGEMKVKDKNKQLK